MKRLPFVFIGSLVCAVVFFTACTNDETSPADEFLLPEGIEITLMAQEPTVVLPVAMCEDIQGRWWVVEMPGYMRDIDGNDEDLPDGRIVILEDSNGDGLLNRRTVFLDSLLNPRAVALVYGGLLHTDGTDLRWTTIQNDQPGPSTLVDSLYVVGGNIEHQPNGLLYNLDNWIYSAKSNARYQRRDGIWIKEATTFRGQWGISMDVNGRLTYNHNSIPMAGDHTLPNTMIKNQYLKLTHSNSVLYTDDMRLFPIQATSVNRGYIDGVLNDKGKVINYTSACSPILYYGNALPESYYGDGFVCAPEANLIANYNIGGDGLDFSATRDSDSTEFLVSIDETFRPVNLYTGFDGGMYIVDLRKGIIQHRAYMSDYLRESILAKKLDEINGKGRIYRVHAHSSDRLRPDFSPNNLTPLLGHKNLSVRMQAQKMLVHLKEATYTPYIINAARDTSNGTKQVHAFWTLHGLDELKADLLNELGQESSNIQVLIHILHLSDGLATKNDNFQVLYQRIWSMKNRPLDYLLASKVGQGASWQLQIWVDLAKRYQNDELIVEALINGAAGNEEDLIRASDMLPGDCNLMETLQQVLVNKKENINQSPQLYTSTFDDNRTNGFKLFKANCSACHGMDGKGQPGMAPALTSSTFVHGPDVEIAQIILYGIPIPSGKYQIPMPAYGAVGQLSDKDITDIVSYLKSTFTAGWSSLAMPQVDSLRNLD